MTEMNESFKRELADVRANFSMMAVMLRNNMTRREYSETPPAGTTFRNDMELRHWYTWNRRVERVHFNREWHGRLQEKHRLHKSVEMCMELARPVDWHQLLLEWPHTSDTDPQRLAYTRDERGARDNRQVVTTIGKYITRHFPTLASHQVRDITALFSSDQCKMVHTTAEMIFHLGRGPQSCMKWSDVDVAHHPYRCYDPRLGWSMAVREEGGDTVARALVYKREGGTAYFVRSYTKNDSFSHSDTILESWLNSQGITKRGDWEGAKLAKVMRGRHDECVFPYIDGSVQTVDVYSDYMLINEDGEFLCNNTDGTSDENDRSTCADCGDHASTDDGYWVNESEDSWVCESCHENYRYVYGYSGRAYYVHEDNAVYVGSNYYDTNHLGDNNIVELHDGDYCDLDNAVYIESCDAYYHIDDSDIVHTCDGEHELMDDCVELANGEWCLTECAWQCTHSDEWYHNKEDYELIDGKKVHPDYVDGDDMDDDEDDCVAPVVAEPTVQEVAAAPAPFTQPAPMSVSHSLGDLLYERDGARIYRRLMPNVEMFRYTATKRVEGRELTVCYNLPIRDLDYVIDAEPRLIQNMLREIAGMEQQYLRERAANYYREQYEAAIRNAILYGTGVMQTPNPDTRYTPYYGRSVTQVIHDEMQLTEQPASWSEFNMMTPTGE